MNSDFWKDASVLVTGAHGFTGSHLCRELVNAGARVKAFVKPDSQLSSLDDILDRITVCRGDVTDFDSLLLHLKGVKYVFNPAAIVPVMDSRKNPQRSFSVNSIGSFNVAYASVQCGVKKMLHVSTCHVYGNQPDSEIPIRETTLPLPGDLYAASKMAAEISIRPLINEGAPIVISRGFAKYGPGQSPQYFIPRVITQLILGETPQLGNLTPTRDYTYIKDMALGYMTLLEKGLPGQIYHLSSERETSMAEVYDIICRIIGVTAKAVTHADSRPQDIMRLWGLSTRARNEFGWKPEISLEDGLARTVEWWKSQSPLVRA